MDSVQTLLENVHLAAAAEAIALAEKAGLNASECYEIIVGAAGNSHAFEKYAPLMIKSDFPLQGGQEHESLAHAYQSLSKVVDQARDQKFPLPITSNALQYFVGASSQCQTPENVHKAQLINQFGRERSKALPSESASAAKSGHAVAESKSSGKVGFIGLGAMGIGMATSIRAAGHDLVAFDLWKPSVDKFVAAGGKAAGSVKEVATDASVLVLVVQNSIQISQILLEQDVASVLANDSVVVVNSTVSPDYIRHLAGQVDELNKGIEIVDAPISGGAARAAKGDLTIITSGSDTAFLKAQQVLQAMSGPAKNLHRVSGGLGAASSVKMINQLLAGVHIAVSAEAMAFGASLNVDTRKLYETVCEGTGYSWMFRNRVPAMINEDWTVISFLPIIVKDLNIVLREASRLGSTTFMAAISQQIFHFAVMMGNEKSTDSIVVKFWQQLGCPSVSEKASS